MNTYQAKRIPLQDILSRLGHEPQHTAKGELWYLSPFRQETDASFKINPERNIWYDFALGEGGNVIGFVMKYFGVGTVSQALSQLDGLEGWVKPDPRPAPPPAPQEKDLGTALSVSRIQPLQNKALIQYLNTRGIAAATAAPYVQEMYYTYTFRHYFALAFPNQSGGYELRNAYFKGACGHKDISLISGAQTEVLTVFEGFMDFLSALTCTGAVPASAPVLVLNSVAMQTKALDLIRQRGVREVHLYLDHDESGRALTTRFQQAFDSIRVIDASDIYRGYKDFNEFLQQRGAVESLVRE